MNHRNVYFVSAFDPIVAEDVAACVAEWDRDSSVHVTASHEETVRLIAAAPSVYAVLAWGSVEALAASGLPDAVAARGGTVVLATDIGTGETSWMRLAVPFTDSCLRKALEAVERGRCTPA